MRTMTESAHIEAPGTVMLPMLYFTTWGRKPG